MADQSLLVPGLRDNIAKGVQRGLLTMTGTEIKEIFRPVVKVCLQFLEGLESSLIPIQEVIRLVLEQIRSTKKPVSAVLLVGGFGSSSFLRDQLRSALGNVPLLQSPNGYEAD